MPIAHALVYIRQRGLSGVLELRASADRHAWLVFWKGRVVSAMTTPTVARFGTVADELGLIDEATLDSTAVEAASSKRPQTDLLLERGVITPEQRDRILVEQVRRRVHHLFTLPPTTTFAFREGQPSLAEPVVAVDVLAQVWRGLCDFPADARTSEVLALIGDHPLRLVNETQLAHAELTPEEMALCEALRGKPRTRVQLRATTKLPAARVELLAYFLVITKCVEVDGVSRANMPSGAMRAALLDKETHPSTGAFTTRSGLSLGSSSSSSSNAMPLHASTARLKATPQPARPPGPADLGPAEVRRRAAGIAAEGRFAVLGLVEGASAEAARAAYFRLNRLWNPDRLSPELEEVRPEVERIWTHMTEAHRVLTDPATPAAVAPRNRR